MIHFLLALSASAAVSFLIVRCATWHLRFTADLPGSGPQKFHTGAVPRIGGLALAAGLATSVLWAAFTLDNAWHYSVLALCLLPAFLGGLAEDFTRRVSISARLLLAVVAAAGAFAWADVRLVRSDVDWLDAALAYAPVSCIATLFAVAGLAHAMNIIDGYNGLSSGLGAIALFTLGLVAVWAGDPLVATFAFGMAGACLGFLLFNYPFGRLFLGDGGAYLIGCALAFASALLVLRNPQVSPWLPFVLVLYPVWETLFSIWRRIFIHGTDIGSADARHLHSLVYRRLARHWVRRRDDKGRALRNAVTTLPFWGVALGLAALALYWRQSSLMLQIVSVLFVGGYCLIYLGVSRLRRPMSRSMLIHLKKRAHQRRESADEQVYAPK